MASNIKELFSQKKADLWSFSLTIFFIVSLNFDWQSNYLIWYGSVGLVVFSYLISFKGLYFKHLGFLEWLFSFIILGAISSIWSLSPSAVFEVLASLIICLFLLFLLQSSINYGFNVDTVFRNYFIATLVNAVYIILKIDVSQLGQIQIGSDLLKGWNANYIGFMAAHGSLIGCYLIKKTNSNFAKASYFLCTVAFSFLTVYTGSRTAFIVLVGGICLFIMASRPSNLIRNIIIASVAIFVSLYIVMNVESFYNVLGSRLESLFSLFSGEGEVDSSARLRSLFIENGKEWFSQEPIMGYGLNNYKILNQEATRRLTYSHNNFIEIAVNLGAVGLILYYSFYVYLFINLLKTLKNNTFNLFMLSALLVELVSHYGTVSYYDFYTNLLLMFCFYAIKKERH